MEMLGGVEIVARVIPEFQLGHIFSDVEMTKGLCWSGPIPQWCFNWATSFQTWKSNESENLTVALFAVDVFQLGHVFSDMEIWKQDESIDPTRENMFQLGHVFSDMEI